MEERMWTGVAFIAKTVEDWIKSSRLIALARGG